MTVVPLPASPCVRVRLIYSNGAGLEAGNRFYLSYSGSAPTGANCTTLASDIATAWNTDIAPLVSGDYDLVEVDVLDIATDSGLSGQWMGSHAGSRAGTGLPNQCATNIEFGLSRRYRGGKPRIYLTGGVETDQADGSNWNSTYIDAVNAGVAAFFAAIAALSVGAMGTLAHVNLSYYSGFTNITNSSGRERAVPKYRAAALVDSVTGYFCKREISSQRRRRTSSTP